MAEVTVVTHRSVWLELTELEARLLEGATRESPIGVLRDIGQSLRDAGIASGA